VTAGNLNDVDSGKRGTRFVKKACASGKGLFRCWAVERGVGRGRSFREGGKALCIEMGGGGRPYRGGGRVRGDAAAHSGRLISRPASSRRGGETFVEQGKRLCLNRRGKKT